jgi:hypothetical protein
LYVAVKVFVLMKGRDLYPEPTVRNRKITARKNSKNAPVSLKNVFTISKYYSLII